MPSAQFIDPQLKLMALLGERGGLGPVCFVKFAKKTTVDLQRLGRGLRRLPGCVILNQSSQILKSRFYGSELNSLVSHCMGLIRRRDLL